MMSLENVITTINHLRGGPTSSTDDKRVKMAPEKLWLANLMATFWILTFFRETTLGNTLFAYGFHTCYLFNDRLQTENHFPMMCFCSVCARARGLDVAALSARAHVVYMGATRVKCSFICTCCLCTLRCEPIYALCLRLLTYVLLSELKCRIRGDQESTVVVAKKTTYSDVSNNHTGTAIYLKKIILPIRSY